MARLGRVIPLAAALSALWVPPAAALEPDQVLVVVNQNVPDSLELGRHYLAVRKVPAENLVAVGTTGDYLVSRADYERQIRDPIRQAVRRRGLEHRIQAMVLLWGVPVRVASPPDPKADLHAFYKVRAARAQHQAALDYKLLGQPAVAGEGDLSPLAEVLGAPAAVEPRPLPTVGAITKDFGPAVQARIETISQIANPVARQAAWRGLLALVLDARGLAGLVALLEKNQTPWNQRLPEYRASAAQAARQLKAMPASAPADVAAARGRLDLLHTTGGAFAVRAYAQKQADATAPPLADAAVDSELALLWWGDYPLDRWLPNPLHYGFRLPSRAAAWRTPLTLMTSRIDGPSPADARRIIDGSFLAEQEGLRGQFYIDIGGPKRAAAYDAVLEGLAAFARLHGRMETVVDRSPQVFGPGACPMAALYVGWYSLQKYVDAFTWAPGAVGFHIASFEAAHLRDSASNEWCPQMIRRGVCATIGAVDEPYLPTLPQVEAMYPLLMTGRMTVAEAYWRTMPTVSWRVTLIADPLYTPFKVNPQVDVKDLPAGLWPATTSPSATSPATTQPAAAPTQPASAGTQPASACVDPRRDEPARRLPAGRQAPRRG
jgi:uncharacterized protein (TIGR03790 family)